MRGETSQIRFAEAQKLLDYGFNNFEYVNFGNKNDTVKTINVDKGVFNTVDAILEDNSGCLIKKGEASNIVTMLNLPDIISSPIEQGQKLGEVTYFIGDKKLATTNIVAKTSVKSIGIGNMTARILENWFTLFR